MLHIYNTLTNKKESFQPKDPEHAYVYVCGPTVYDYAHIGNARPAVAFDVLRRLMQVVYGNVTYISNVTDIDDKIITRTQELNNGSATNEQIAELSTKFLNQYITDMNQLNVLEPTYRPKATAYIDEMIELIQNLIDKGFAYEPDESDGHVLMDVTKYQKYGQLSNKRLDDLISGARVEQADYKKNPVDFVLWKPSLDNQPAWHSPWGKGRPGWHTECIVMIHSLIDDKLDLHCGGGDLIFPHHENEIIQFEVAYNKQFAPYWMHNAHLTIDGAKMSKSLGNFITIADLLQQYNGEVIRMMLLMTNYRKPLDLTNDKLKTAFKLLNRLYNTMVDVERASLNTQQNHNDNKVVAALLDDLNSSLAITHLLSYVKEYSKNPSLELANTIYTACQVLGLWQMSNEQWHEVNQQIADNNNQSSTKAATKSDDNVDYPDEVQQLIMQRDQARTDKDFAKSDQIRDQLTSMGYTVIDSPDGTKLQS